MANEDEGPWMTDADIDRIAERVADKLWERWNLHANVQIRRVFEQMMNEPVPEIHCWGGRPLHQDPDGILSYG
jgi:hypothetical protein